MPDPKIPDRNRATSNRAILLAIIEMHWDNGKMPARLYLNQIIDPVVGGSQGTARIRELRLAKMIDYKRPKPIGWDKTETVYEFVPGANHPQCKRWAQLTLFDEGV